MKTLRVVVVVVLALLPVGGWAQRENTFYAKAFQSAARRTVGAMVAAAQQSCDPNTSLPCVIVIDPTLAAFSSGTMPSRCAQCTWIDYRTAGQVLINGTATTQAVNAVCDGDTSKAALNSAAMNAAYLRLPVLPGNFQSTTNSGAPVRVGYIQMPPGDCVIDKSRPLLGPDSGILGAGWYATKIRPAPGIAASGPEWFVIDFEPVSSVQGGGSPLPASTFGTRVIGLTIDCQGGPYGGTNTFASAVRFYGAQGARVDDLQITNCGQRGFAGLGGSGVKVGAVWAFGCTVGPCFTLDGMNGTTITQLSCENSNITGASTLLGQKTSCLYINNALFTDIRRLQTEDSAVAVRVRGSTVVHIGMASISAPAGGATDGILLTDGTLRTRIDDWGSFRASPNLYTNFINDLVKGRTRCGAAAPGGTCPTSNPFGTYSQDDDDVGAISIGGEQMTGAARSIWSPVMVGTFGSATIAGPHFKPDKNITITRVQMHLATAPAGACSPFPVFGVSNAAGTDLTTALSTFDYDSGPISVAVPAGTDLAWSVRTAGVGCSTFPGHIQGFIQYR